MAKAELELEEPPISTGAVESSSVSDAAGAGPTVPGWRPTLLLILLLALVFQGSRGLWEPDEAFYGVAAAEMFDGGSWLVPMLEGRPFLDKPPLVYWGSVAGMQLLGRNEWGLRLVHALAFVLAALAVGGIGRTLWDRDTGRWAALVYATSLGPFLAANVLTPDMLLAAAVAGFYLGYVRAEAAEEWRERLGAWLLAGLAAGLGLLAKGPALLLFAAPSFVHLAWRRRLVAVLLQPGPWLGGLLAAALGASWYLWIARTIPGAAAYLLDNQVVGRLATGAYKRNAGTFGGIRVYAPTLVALALPWSVVALGALFRGRATVGRGISSPHRDPERRGAAAALLWAWLFLPLAILVVARSRLPLYALPLGAPLALGAARILARAPGFARALESRRWRVAFAVWCLALLGIKGAAARWPADQDSRAFAALVREAGGARLAEVVSVDARRRALAFYLRPEMEQVRGFQPVYPFFSALETFEEEVEEARQTEETTVFVFQRDNLETGLTRLRVAGLDCAERTAGTRRHAIVACVPAQPFLEALEAETLAASDG